MLNFGNSYNISSNVLDPTFRIKNKEFISKSSRPEIMRGSTLGVLEGEGIEWKPQGVGCFQATSCCQETHGQANRGWVKG